MGSYDVRGFTVNSDKYGVLPFLIPVFNAVTEVPSYTRFDSAVELSTRFPSYPFEVSLLSAKSDVAGYETYQYRTYWVNWGFPSVFPVTMEDVFALPTYPDKTYRDIWTFDNGAVYYVFSGDFTNQRWLYLNADENDSEDTRIRITPSLNQNLSPGMSFYSLSLDERELQAVYLLENYDGAYFECGDYTSIPVSVSATDAEIAFYKSIPYKIDDPYEEGGTSGTGGGTGTFDGTGDAISFPSLPTLSAVSTGFVTLYAPTLSQLNSLASYMWSGGFDIDTFRKLFADPMDVILGLSIVPVAVPISGMQDVKVGNISTGVSMNKASTQYVNVDCGTLQVKEYWGSCLDYAPNSKCQIYLPYIGTRSIDIDEIMGKTIHVKYAVDILSGALVANIMCGSSVLYSFSGACASSIPVVSRDFTSIISSAINIAGSIGMAVATGGLSTPVSAASAVQIGVAAGQTAMNVANSKPSVQHSGAAGGTSGMLGVQTPYLIFELPRQSLPQGYNTFGGYPANITLQLGSCTGFTKVEMIHLENIPATDTELNEIETLLKAGVIL